MAYISIQPSDFFNTVLYTGNASTQSITGVGFQPDFCWLKKSNATEGHNLFDTVRGVGETIMTSSSNAQATEANKLTAFNADGFSLGDNSETNGSFDFSSWSWKAGTTTGIDTTGSTITPSSYSFNASAGISIVQYTGNDTAGAKVPHGLGVAPDLVIVKTLGGSNSWVVQHQVLGPTKYMYLNTTAAEDTNSTRWNDTAPDSVNVTLGSGGNTNGSGGDSPLIMYSFATKKGFSRFGRFRGNGDVNGSFVFTGFRPAFLLIKKYSGAGDGWYMVDNTNNPKNVVNKNFFADTTGALSTAGSAASDKNMDFLSNGFKPRTTNGEVNQSNEQYIYIAFSAFPMVSSNSKAGVAR